MPYNFVGDSFHTRIADFLQAKCDFRWKTAVWRFWAPFGGGGLGASYYVHIRLIGKGVVDFLLVLTELFALPANIDWKSLISLQ